MQTDISCYHCAVPFCNSIFGCLLCLLVRFSQWLKFIQPPHTLRKCVCVVRRVSQIICRFLREANRNLYGVFTTCRASLNLLVTEAPAITVICRCRAGLSHLFYYRRSINASAWCLFPPSASYWCVCSFYYTRNLGCLRGYYVRALERLIGKKRDSSAKNSAII